MQAEEKRLLEMAAKAMGWTQAEFQDMRGWGEVRYGFSEAMWVPEIGGYWNPLTDDGDALRLATALRIDMEWDEQLDGRTVEAYHRTGDAYFCATEPEADYRRAIVRAAAAIGEKMT